MAEPGRRSRFGRLRAASLVGVHLLIAIHIAHWLVVGETLAPLEINEVLYTLHRGIVTAAFVFMGLIVVSVAVFGRFFCSWGCHMLALQDLCAWLLARVGIRPRRVRSRALLLVAPLATAYLFVWPQVERMLAGRELPEFVVLSDAEGWASFFTTDFWRNLPGVAIALATFLVCGFIVVYILGSRAFCTNACPYGPLFAMIDRFALGRIVATGDCRECGRCTAGCQSGVRVQEEIKRYGMVVNSACLKDLDCVGTCPHGVLAYGFRRPPLLHGRAVAGEHGLTRVEEILVGAVALAVVLISTGLYDFLPFLMALGLAITLAYFTAVGLRLPRAASLRLGHFALKRGGEMTRAGRAFAGFGAVLVALLVHSAVVRYHEVVGQRAFGLVASQKSNSGAEVDREQLGVALRHFETCATVGLVKPTSLHRRLGSLYLLDGQTERAIAELEVVLNREPDDTRAREQLGDALWQRADRSTAQGDHAGALISLERVVQLQPDSVRARTALAALLARDGRPEEALPHLQRALELDATSSESHNNLGVVLLRLGRFEQATKAFRATIGLAPRNAAAHTNLGAALLRQGQLDAAADAFRRALELDPSDLRAREGMSGARTTP